MRLILLDNIEKELKKSQKAILYGIQEEKITVVSSLKNKLGLKKLGIFSFDKKDIDNETLVLSMKNGIFECKHLRKDKNFETIEVETVNYTTDFNKRNHGIIDSSVLQEKTVTIIGLGSGGSAIAIDLVRCGVTNLILVDFDIVNLSNLCRSVYDLTDLNKEKTQALLEKLLMINPCLNTTLYNEDIFTMDHDKLIEIIHDSDLIIEATDSMKSKTLINGLAYHSTPVIYAAVYEFGKGGDILFTSPTLPCFECIFKSIANEMKELRKGDWDYSTGQAKPMPALISDIQIVVARTVKIALGILSVGSEDSFLEKITEPGCSMLFIGNEKNVFIFDKPFQEIWAETEIDPECSCQTLM